MGRNDQNNGKREQKQLIIVPILLGKQEKHTSGKQQKRKRTPVMSGETMPQGQGPDDEGQPDHTRLEPEIMDDIYPENGKPGQEQGQNGAMHRTGYRSTYPNKIRVDPFHE